MRLQCLCIASLIFTIALLNSSGLISCQNVVFPQNRPAKNTQTLCVTPNGASGDCVFVLKCRSLWESKDYALLRESVCGYQGDVPKVCCPTIKTTATTPTETWVNQARRPQGEGFVAGNTDEVSTPWGGKEATTMLPSLSPETGPRNMPDANGGIKLLFPKDCGKNSVTFRRIVNGQNSVAGTWPWMVAIFLSRKGIKSAECGGVLITSKHVLTAAHCMINRRGATLRPSSVSVKIGELDLESDDDGADPIDVNVKRIIKHKDFNPSTYQSDIAILELSSYVRFRKHIAPICLPLEDSVKNTQMANKNAFTAGWGTTSFDGPSSSALQEVQIEIWENKDCKEVFGKDAPITNLNICAGDGDKDSCRGDSGGPLMLPYSDGRFYVIGIVSFGRKCAESGYPGVYTRVTSFLDWIQQTVNSTMIV